MTRLSLLLMISGAFTLGAAEAATAQSARVDSLLSRMTLDEKVGQMTQVTLAVVAAQGSPQHTTVALDPAKLREAVVRRGVGSILNVLGGALTLQAWHGLVTEIQKVAVQETRLGIPVVYGVDAVHGMNYTRDATIFPHNLALAATFDPDLARQAGEITGREVLASALPWNFAPVLDVGRQPLFPRFYETFGEDPLVAARLGAATVEGMQGAGPLAATLKHYLGYSGPRTGRDRTPAPLTERDLRENYLPPFAAAVRAGARTVMVNSGEIDGVPVHASRYWLHDVLRGELGFQGVVVTDWEDVIFLHTRHRVAPTLKEAVRMAVEAGIDVSMTPNDFGFADLLVELVREGTIPESRVDASVRRILLLKEALGLFDDPVRIPAGASVGAPAAREVARRAAREAITLLKNERNVLPLRRDVRVLVTGPAAFSMTALNGGWTYTWQGSDASVLPDAPRTVLEAILRRAPDTRYVPGATFTAITDVDAAMRAAQDVDVAVVVVGEDAYAEWVGDLPDLTLPEAQLRLIEAVQATGTPTVLVLVEGRPRVIERVADGAEAIVMAYWPGMEGGEAIAGVLFGETNPSGKLPFTYPRHPNALDTYDHRYTETLGSGFDRAPGAGFVPQFEFGHGLSYTTFAYADLQLGAPRVRAGEPVTARVTVRNTGSRAGTETVLLFSRQHFASVTPAVRKLRGFQKVTLQPGESRTVSFTLSSEELAFIGRQARPVLEPGSYDLMVGGLTATFELTPR